ncbi:hypothetical protein CEXT_42531 [Caerostris extrusa]|uniref:Uncharacterized protein n=1 Tax=Caerostris extrusa TaxID=172846 RepID=A0AAV4NKP5_CAEEX|nr:hypothetical protein CEXT_42531 [Caerostris extrusa]
METMDLSPSGRRGKPPQRDDPLNDSAAYVSSPEVTDEVNMGETGSDQPNAYQTQKYDQTYLQNKEQMDSMCKNLGISHNEVPAKIIDLKDRIEYLNVAKQIATSAPNTEQRQQSPPAPPKRSNEKKAPGL